MNESKESKSEKKSFWKALFAPKKSCCCASGIIEEIKEEKAEGKQETKIK